MRKFLILLFCCIVLNASAKRKSTSVGGKKVVCYFGSWANYKVGEGRFTVEDIDPKLCTHVVYGFAKLEANKIAAFDPWLDLSKDEPGGGLNAYHRFTTELKRKNPALKTLIAIGGWNEGSVKYSQMVSNEASRNTFVDSVVKFLDKYNFDGLDFDWEHPAARGGNANDKNNFSRLLRSLHDRLKGRRKLLTLAVSANPATADAAFDIPTISRLVDFISIMAYDYHGAFDTRTGHNAPLYARKDDADRTFHVAAGIDYWLSKGAPNHKIILGMPLYGRTVKLANRNNNGLGQSISGPGDKGSYSGEPGVLYYREICQNVNNKQWTKKWDSQAKVPYMYKGDQWVSYDNEQSLGLKVDFAMKRGLGGLMVWSLEGDDFKNKCHKGKNSLLKSAKKAMSKKSKKSKKSKH